MGAPVYWWAYHSHRKKGLTCGEHLLTNGCETESLFWQDANHHACTAYGVKVASSQSAFAALMSPMFVLHLGDAWPLGFDIPGGSWILVAGVLTDRE